MRSRFNGRTIGVFIGTSFFIAIVAVVLLHKSNRARQPTPFPVLHLNRTAARLFISVPFFDRVSQRQVQYVFDELHLRPSLAHISRGTIYLIEPKDRVRVIEKLKKDCPPGECAAVFEGQRSPALKLRWVQVLSKPQLALELARNKNTDPRLLAVLQNERWPVNPEEEIRAAFVASRTYRSWAPHRSLPAYEIKVVSSEGTTQYQYLPAENYVTFRSNLSSFPAKKSRLNLNDSVVN